MRGLGLPIQMLNGLHGFGCPDCGGTCNSQPMYGFGAVTDYDKITVGGKTYTANQLLDKTVIASKDTKIYSGAYANAKVVGTIKSGQPIGKVFSYLRPDQADGRGWLMFETNTYNKFYYAPNEAASSTGLKDQGTLTVTQEVKAENDTKLKEDSPVEYYLKKYGTTVLLVLVGTIVVVSLGKEAVKGAFTKKPDPTPALSGTKKRKRKTK